MVLTVSKKPDGAAEIFHSIQGEGINAGRPAIFLRLGDCNLKCSWCDTKYTWDWKSYDREQQLLIIHLDDAEKEIRKFICKYIVITGGEPLLQQNTLIALLENLKKSQYYIEIETNGTVMPETRLIRLVDHWSVSPKLSNSGNALTSREKPECYLFFSRLSQSHFKYVIRDASDFVEAQALIKKYGLYPEKVIMMPEAQTRKELIEKSRRLVELCIQNEYLFSTRLQVWLWGNKRGK